MRPRGLTLAELMLSVGLMAVVILIVAAVFIGGLRLMTRSEKRTEASNIGRQVLERIEDDGGFDAVPEADAVFDGVPAVDGFPPAPYPLVEGRYTITVEHRELSPSIRAVLVKVAWAEGSLSLERAYHQVE